MEQRITGLQVRDIRFPTSKGLHGSDAMNPQPDYSCAYVTLFTNDPELEGHGLTFTIGRGNELCVQGVKALERFVVGRHLDGLENDLAGFWRSLVSDSQLRWLGPEKGVVHLSAAAVVNAVWDLLAKRAGQPVWAYVAAMSPEHMMSALDFSYVEDFLPKERALERLQAVAPTKPERIKHLMAEGYPAYTTSAGWLGYDDARFRSLLETTRDHGWRRVKLKVGLDLQHDRQRLAVAREVLGPEARLMIDANQVWTIDQSIAHIQALSAFDLHWVEEPTHPDDVLGHQAIARAVTPVRLASGEHCHNRLMFKQFLQAEAVSYLQVDACRLAGLNEVLTVALMAAEKDVPICPHAGGVGLCEYAQHLSMIDYVCISVSLEDRVVEHAGQLHDIFAEPICVRGGAYMPPQRPGFSVDIDEETAKAYTHTGATL